MIFLDSSFLIAYSNPVDEHREKAVKIMDDLIAGKYGKPYVSDYVFDEVVTVVFVRTKDLSLAITIGNILKNSLEIINIDNELFDKSWQIFKSQANTKFSFTDCTILAAMERDGIKYVATFDEDFDSIKDVGVIS